MIGNDTKATTRFKYRRLFYGLHLYIGTGLAVLFYDVITLAIRSHSIITQIFQSNVQFPNL